MASGRVWQQSVEKETEHALYRDVHGRPGYVGKKAIYGTG